MMTGCFGGGGGGDVELMDATTAEAVIAELDAAANVGAESAGMTFIGSFAGGPGDASEAVQSVTTMELSLESESRPLALVGACAGVDGFASIHVVGGSTAVLQCTAEGEPYEVQTVIERHFPGSATLTTEIIGMPVGAVWSITVAGLPK